jgi:hypothetical protein
MKSFILFIALLFTLMSTTNIALAAPSQQAIPPCQETGGEEYVVQADDWLSKIALKYYGDMFAYPVIVEATNAQAAEDDSFTVIDNPDLIEMGQKLWIPPQGQVEMLVHCRGSYPYPTSPPFKVSYDPSIWEFVEDYGSSQNSQLIHRDIPGCFLLLRAGPLGAPLVSTTSLAGYEWEIFLTRPQLLMYSATYSDIAFIFGLFLPDPFSEEVKSPCQQAAEDVFNTFEIVNQ